MAASAYFDQVQKLYIAYFGRPADPAGLNFWAQNIDAAGGNFDSAIAGFSSSAESKTLYASKDTSQLVTSIYLALFNRNPEPAGLAFWVGQIDSNTLSGARAAYEILNSAAPGDAVPIANKVAAANAFTANIDTNAELAGYSGASSAAIARAWLAKVDATPYSIANLTSDATKGVADATGVQPSAPTTPAGPSFTATKDGSDVVTLTNAGIGTIGVSVTEVGGVYTFTNSGPYAGSATVVGPISSIVLSPTNASLSISSSLAEAIMDHNAIRFPNVITFSTGTIRLSDTTAVSATLLTKLDKGSKALMDATRIPGITEATVDQAFELLVTSNGNSGDKIWTKSDVAVTLNSTTATAAALKAVQGATTGLVDASTVTSLTPASVADAQLLLLTNQGGTGDKIKMAANVAVALSNTDAAAGDLNAIDSSTTGLVSAASLTSISGTIADVKISLKAITSGAALYAAGLTSVMLTDAITASDLDNVVFANNATITLADVTGNALTMEDATVDSGKTLTIDGSGLTGSNSLNFNGTAETNGSFVIKSGAGADTIAGSANADTFTGGAGIDQFSFSAANRSTLARMDTITDFRVAGGAADVITINDITAVASNINTVLNFSAQASLAAALNVFANANTTSNGLGVFIWGGDTYAYVETTGNKIAYVAGDTVIKLSGTPFAEGASIVGLGIGGV